MAGVVEIAKLRNQLFLQEPVFSIIFGRKKELSVGASKAWATFQQVEHIPGVSRFWAFDTQRFRRTFPMLSLALFKLLGC